MDRCVVVVAAAAAAAAAAFSVVGVCDVTHPLHDRGMQGSDYYDYAKEFKEFIKEQLDLAVGKVSRERLWSCVPRPSRAAPIVDTPGVEHDVRTRATAAAKEAAALCGHADGRRRLG
jgi:hypothetical protein